MFVLDGISLFGDILGDTPKMFQVLLLTTQLCTFDIWFIQHVLGKSLRAFLGTTNDGHTSVSTSPLLIRRWLPIYVFLISSLCSCQLLWHVHPVRACSGHMGCIACFLGGGFVSQPDTKKTFDFARGSQGPANRIL